MSKKPSTGDASTHSENRCGQRESSTEVQRQVPSAEQSCPDQSSTGEELPRTDSGGNAAQTRGDEPTETAAQAPESTSLVAQVLDRLPDVLGEFEMACIGLKLKGIIGMTAVSFTGMTIYKVVLDNPQILKDVAAVLQNHLPIIVASFQNSSLQTTLLIKERRDLKKLLQNLNSGELENDLNMLRKNGIIFDSPEVTSIDIVPTVKPFKYLDEEFQKSMKELSAGERPKEIESGKIVLCPDYADPTKKVVSIYSKKEENKGTESPMQFTALKSKTTVVERTTEIETISVHRNDQHFGDKHPCLPGKYKSTNIEATTANTDEETHAQNTPAVTEPTRSLTNEGSISQDNTASREVTTSQGKPSTLPETSPTQKEKSSTSIREIKFSEPWKVAKSKLAARMGLDDMYGMFRMLTSDHSLSQTFIDDIGSLTRKQQFYKICDQLEKELGDEFTLDLLQNHFEEKRLKLYSDIIAKCKKMGEGKEKLSEV